MVKEYLTASQRCATLTVINVEKITMNRRYKPEVRKDAIVTAALRLAAATHYLHVQRKQIADELGVTPPALTYHFGTMEQLRRAIMRAAVEREDVTVVAQGLVAQDKHAKKAPEALRRRAIELAMG
jgi:AcrR family transcriptional regulator